MLSLREKASRVVAQRDRDAQRAEPRGNVADLQLDDRSISATPSALEAYDLVDAIEQFGPQYDVEFGRVERYSSG